jgi:hypothetical protein
MLPTRWAEEKRLNKKENLLSLLMKFLGHS